MYVGRTPLKTLEIDDSFSYLGAHFNPNGRTLKAPPFSVDMEILRKAALKPQQNFFPVE